MNQEESVFIGRYDQTFIFKAKGQLTQKSLWDTNMAVQACMEDPSVADLLIDISDCAYMDSTILGILARWAISFARTHATQPFLIGLQGNLLENIFKRMNLTSLFYISTEPQHSPPATLSKVASSQQYSEQEYAKYLLAAHQTLAGLSSENAKKFATVIECLKTEMYAQEGSCS